MKRFAALLLFVAALPSFAQKTRITLEDLVNVVRDRPGVLSPDGRNFAIIDKGQVALQPVTGGPSHPVTSTIGSKSEVSWSPDSKKLAFVSKGSIWVVSASDGEPLQITDGIAGPGDPRGAADHLPKWNPKGKWILYESGRTGSNELWVVTEDGKEKNNLAPLEVYTGEDATNNPSPDHGDAVSSDRFAPNPAWSPDGTRVSYTERSRPYFSGKLKILAFDQTTGRANEPALDVYVAKNDTGGAWAVNTAAWSPDGKTLAVVLQETGWDKVFLIPAIGGKPRQLTKGESEDETPTYSPDGKSIAIVSNRDSPEEHHIWIIPANGSAPRRLTHLSGIEADPQWSPDGQTIYFQRGTVFRAPSTYAAAIHGDHVHPLKPSPPSVYEQAGTPEPEVFHFHGKDGLQLAGILYRPKGYRPGSRYPLVIWAHGGPEGQVVLSLSPWSLYLAQEGYLVFEPNFRGSTGYGEHFRNLNVEDSGGGEIDDIGASVKALVDRGLADPKRVAIGGGSHGGTVVANAVAKLPDTFAAGIEMFGVVDRALFLRYTNRNSRIRWEKKMGGSPEAKPAVYRRANVLPDVDKIRTPLLIMHGEQDPQVPPQESQEFVAALKSAGKTYEYVTYPHEGHGFRQPDHLLDSYQRQLAFLQKYLRQTGPIE
jgi:dipeptidyl aminopeptidase/acylaminoacyl peptidase